jgi:cytosine/adenosine deaminase-related metal-dependent hydrolase
MTLRLLHADAVLPGDGDALRDGAVVVDERGTIVDVGPADDLVPRHAGLAREPMRGVLMPGLVNAHTHIELSGLRGKVAGSAGFVPWVERFIGIRAGERPEEDEAAVEAGVVELERAGTVAVGEVTNTLAAVPALARHGIGGIVFHEVFGLDRERTLAKLRSLEEHLATTLAEWPSADLAYTPAPHTVYTTHPDAVRRTLELARARGVHTSVHLAEHAAERTFLAEGRGPFADLAKRLRFGVEGFPVPGKGPIALASDLGLLASDVLLVHLTDARPEELAEVAASGAPVVLCPRSNLYIEVKLPPLPEILRAGITPALGTDSLASNLSLDVLAEARALAERFPSISRRTLVEMATAAGARALGRADLGRIAKGTTPGLVWVAGELEIETDPFAWTLAQPLSARRWCSRKPSS